MRKESKRVISVTTALLFAFLALSTQPAVRGVAGAVQPRQSVSNKPDQQVVARVTVRTQQELESLVESGVNLLNGRHDQDVFILTTVAKFEELVRQGWQATMMFVRGLDANSGWQSVEAPLGGCSFTIDPTYKSVTALGGTFSFNLIASDPGCEWTAFSSVPWIHINGVGQGTGSATIMFTVDANNTSSNRFGNIFVGGEAYTLYQGQPFNDVPPSDPFYQEIERLSARGVTLGCGDGNFCPNQVVPREQIAAFIMRARGEFNPPTPAMQRFADVFPSNPFYNFIDRLAELGITLGCGNGNYCPTQPVLREQSSAFIIRGLGEFSPPTPATQRFADVPPSNQFYNFIDRMAALGITLGCGGNNFCPTLGVTRAQMAAFLVRAFNL